MRITLERLMMLNDCRRHVRVDYPYERERDQFGGDLLTLKARKEPIDEFRKKIALGQCWRRGIRTLIL